VTTRIGCGEAVQRLWEFLDQALEEPDHREVEQHLAFCRRCCGELEFARQLRHVLAAGGTTDLPADVHDRLERVIEHLDDHRGDPSGKAAT
jgi:anti-sigma factor (TIGR02949 family)